ncbi:MAG: hypothetical protein HC912_12525 [Saprospiraceae bacterium]|nr:hypothetical protein [Saprospiraceae bacterium]
MYSVPYKKGKFKANQGESYILLAQFSAEGLKIESINAYGASNRKDSPHYTDQMQQYTQQQLKKNAFRQSRSAQKCQTSLCP